jgi:Ni/Co efflux regulator RcnB
MNLKLLVTVLCLFLFAFVGQAQQVDPGFAESLKIQRTPFGQLEVKNRMKMEIRADWNGRRAIGEIHGAIHDPEFRAKLNISDEQFRQIEETFLGSNPYLSPEVQAIFKERNASYPADEQALQNLDEATVKKYLDFQEKVFALTDPNLEIAKVIEKSLTPEQNKKINEVRLASMLEMSAFSPKMFEALDLTNAQKRQMETIRKELEAEFEEMLDELANVRLIEHNLWNDMLEKQMDPSIKYGTIEFTLKSSEIGNKWRKENPEIEKTMEKIRAQGKLYAEQYKTRMFNVLTDEQWVRLQKLIDDPPEHAKAFLGKLKEQKKVWMPGPNSWRPGDPIPEQYRQQREEQRTRQRPGFPRTESG